MRFFYSIIFVFLFFIGFMPTDGQAAVENKKSSNQSLDIKPTVITKKKTTAKIKRNTNNKTESNFDKKISLGELPKATPVKKKFTPIIENLTLDKTSIPQITKKQMILIDPGHGAGDEGAKMQGCVEKNLCLLTALHLKYLLQLKGYQIVMTRAQDEFVSLDKRVEIANQSNCHMFVSIHYNAAKSKEASGIEIFFPKNIDTRQGVSKKLAQNVLNKLLAKTGAKSRGIKIGNYHVIRETSMPAILVEGGFMTHPIEGQMLGSLHYIQQIAEGIADGIEHFCLTHFR